MYLHADVVVIGPGKSADSRSMCKMMLLSASCRFLRPNPGTGRQGDVKRHEAGNLFPIPLQTGARPLIVAENGRAVERAIRRGAIDS